MSICQMVMHVPHYVSCMPLRILVRVSRMHYQKGEGGELKLADGVRVQPQQEAARMRIHRTTPWHNDALSLCAPPSFTLLIHGHNTLSSAHRVEDASGWVLCDEIEGGQNTALLYKDVERMTTLESRQMCTVHGRDTLGPYSMHCHPSIPTCLRVTIDTHAHTLTRAPRETGGSCKSDLDSKQNMQESTTGQV